MESSVKVLLRIRPLLEREVDQGEASKTLSVDSDEAITGSQVTVRCPYYSAQPTGPIVAGSGATGVTGSTGMSNEDREKVMNFEFDRVYDENVSQDHLYSDSIAPMLDAYLSGINCTVLAYGQTGSGKSYSMGTFHDNQVTNIIPQTETDQGILPRFMSTLFKRLVEMADPDSQNAKIKLRSYTLKIGFIELYNEEFYDLLKPPATEKNDSTSTQWQPLSSPKAERPEKREKNANIQIREDQTGSVIVTGAEEVVCSSFEDAMECLTKGTQHRTTAATAMNEHSSRSHAIFTITLQQTVIDSSKDNETKSSSSSTTVSKSTKSNANTKSNGQPVQITSKFHFVDLAGSERLKRTLSTGTRASEGIAINQGLLVLGKVITALTEQSSATDAQKVFVPYRDSKLTRLLQNSLGGNSKTVMIACVSPSKKDLPETVNTLKYATRARKIKNKCRINIQSKAASNGDINAPLLRQIQELQMQVSLLENQVALPSADFEHLVQENAMLRTHIQSLHNEQEMLTQEISRRDVHHDYQIGLNKVMSDMMREDTEWREINAAWRSLVIGTRGLKDKVIALSAE